MRLLWRQVRLYAPEFRGRRNKGCPTCSGASASDDPLRERTSALSRVYSTDICNDLRGWTWKEASPPRARELPRLSEANVLRLVSEPPSVTIWSLKSLLKKVRSNTALSWKNRCSSPASKLVLVSGFR